MNQATFSTREVMRATGLSARQLQWWTEPRRRMNAPHNREPLIPVAVRSGSQGYCRYWRREDVWDVKFLSLALNNGVLRQRHRDALSLWRCAGRPVNCLLIARIDGSRCEDWRILYEIERDAILAAIAEGREFWMLWIPERIREAHKSDDESGIIATR